MKMLARGVDDDCWFKEAEQPALEEVEGRVRSSVVVTVVLKVNYS